MFGFGKKYPDRAEYYSDFLMQKFEMKWFMAKEYVTCYGKKLSQYHFNLNNHYSCVLDGVREKDISYSLVADFGIQKVCLTIVAQDGYMKDLKGSGRHVGDSLEYAIVGILVKNTDVLQVYDSGLCRFIINNLDTKWPYLKGRVFEDYSVECLTLRLSDSKN